MGATQGQVATFDIPILLMVFNRLEHSKKVFESIRRIAPSRLYIASDGPRDHKPGEKEKVQELREFLAKSVDWECKVETLYREKNLGCKKAVSEAITWFFHQEEMGIILEDDCLPSHSFFPYCKELLLKYKDDTRIWMISGYNVIDGAYATKHSYLFTNFGFCWGWATWRRAWKNFDVNMTLWPKAKTEDIIHTYPFFSGRLKEWEDTYNNLIDTWDYQWYFTVASNSGLSIVPNRNLVKNIGFGKEATHTFTDSEGRGKIEANEISGAISHPVFVFYDKKYEDIFLKKVVKKPSLFGRIKNKIRNTLNK